MVTAPDLTKIRRVAVGKMGQMGMRQGSIEDILFHLVFDRGYSKIQAHHHKQTFRNVGWITQLAGLGCLTTSLCDNLWASMFYD